ncbi:MAG: Mur ligase family protein [Aerococcaceae bacterium]|nr:Mur ligase family protein [Aerococcaceae bacterium]
MNYGNFEQIKKIRQQLAMSGHPEQQFQTIHVAGTNGKGSTSAMVAAILQALGYRVGVFTSPYLHSPYEQIQVNGLSIKEEDFLRWQKKLAQSTFSEFEQWVLVAIHYFAEQKCDYVVLECGLGGEYDATNIVMQTEYVLFTKISLDHTEWLGDTIKKIATTKAKIIRSNSQVIVAPNQHDEVKAVIHAECAQQQATCHLAPLVSSPNWNGVPFAFNLKGHHQLENLSTVLQWYALFCQKEKLLPNADVLSRALGKLKVLGRMEQLSGQLWVDVAHNEDSVAAFVDYVREQFAGQSCAIVVGFLKDKDVGACLAHLQEIASHFVVTEPDFDARKMDAEQLVEVLHQLEVSADKMTCIKAPQEAIQWALHQFERVFVVGSFYLVKEAYSCI